jgi:hypothetical protein
MLNQGELGNFCPVCLQVGFNLPDDWKDDPNRWVFRRVLTADGNFKADHVRQKLAADDIWLSHGLGMTMKNSEYKDFLENAKEHHTVSVTQSWSDVPNVLIESIMQKQLLSHRAGHALFQGM